MTSRTKDKIIVLVVVIALGSYLSHIHKDIMTIQHKLGLLDECGRVIPEYEDALRDMRNRLTRRN